MEVTRVKYLFDDWETIRQKEKLREKIGNLPTPKNRYGRWNLEELRVC